MHGALALQETADPEQPVAKRRKRSKHTIGQLESIVPAAQLPGELLVAVLQHVGQQQRIRVCSLVCRAWRDAAAAATTSLIAKVSGPHSMPCLSSWLVSNNVQPAAVSLSGVSTLPRQSLCLPYSQLGQLRQLQLDFVQLAPQAGVCCAECANCPNHPQVRPLTGSCKGSCCMPDVARAGSMLKCKPPSLSLALALAHNADPGKL
jgi:hypothetical protein